MLEANFYLNDGRFTGRGYANLNDIASRITGETLIDNIDELVKSLPFKKDSEVWRKRTASQIIEDRFVTGCTDSALVFVTLARIKGIPAAYVESIEEHFLQNPEIGDIQGHIFVDVYSERGLVSYNPGHGITDKQRKIYLWSPKDPDRRYTEIARGLDFSQLYVNDELGQIELITEKQIRNLINKLRGLPPQ